MKIRHVVFLLLLLMNGLFVMVPAAKEIREYKELLSTKNALPSHKQSAREGIIHNDLSAVSMLQDLETMMARCGLQVEQRRLSSQILQGVNKVSIELWMTGQREDVRHLLMEEAFQKKRYGITALRMEYRSSKETLLDAEEEEASKAAPGDARQGDQSKTIHEDAAQGSSPKGTASGGAFGWWTHLTVCTYFRE